jgi:hypothetical protein
MNMNKNILLSLVLSLVISGCVTTTSTLVDSNITSYNYNSRMKLTNSYNVSALKAITSDSETNTETVGLKLTYTDSDKAKQELLIPADKIGAFKFILLQKSQVTEGTSDGISQLEIGLYKQLNVSADFVDGERIVSIASLDGVFALKQKGVKDLFRLLDEIQKGIIK